MRRTAERVFCEEGLKGKIDPSAIWRQIHHDLSVMPGLVPGIHDLNTTVDGNSWMPGTRPGMTGGGSAA